MLCTIGDESGQLWIVQAFERAILLIFQLFLGRTDDLALFGNAK